MSADCEATHCAVLNWRQACLHGLAAASFCGKLKETQRTSGILMPPSHAIML